MSVTLLGEARRECREGGGGEGGRCKQIRCDGSCLLRTAITKTFSTTKHTANSTHRTRVSRQCCRPITLAQHQSAVPPSKSLHIHARFPPEDLKHPSPQLRLAIAPQRRAPLLIDKQTLCPIPVILDSNPDTTLTHLSGYISTRISVFVVVVLLLLFSLLCCCCSV